MEWDVNSFEDLARAANDFGVSLSCVNKALAEWNKAMDDSGYLASVHGKWMISSRRRYWRRWSKCVGYWRKHHEAYSDKWRVHT